MYMDDTGIDLFDQKADNACGKVGPICTWILLVLIDLIKMQVMLVVKFASDIHGYHWY